MEKFEEVLPGIFVLKVPFSVVWTGIVLVKGEKNFLIDSSQEEPEQHLIPALEALGMKLSDIDWLLNTHCHGDHIGGHHTLVTKYGLKTAVIEQGAASLRDPAKVAIRVRTKFPENSPPPQSYLKGVEPDLILKEGELLEGRLFPIWTPGHEWDCTCWYDTRTKTIFSGDSLQANGTPTQGIGFYQDLDAYRWTLSHLVDYDIENIVCGHEYDGIGSVVAGKSAVAAALKTCGDYVSRYAAWIAAETAKGAAPLCTLTTRLIDAMGCGMPEKLFLALYTVDQHLKPRTQIAVPYDKVRLTAEVPTENLQGVFTSSLPPAPADEGALVDAALDAPIESASLEDLARGKRTALVIASDHTRPVPSRIIMPRILARLRRGQPDIDVTILIATGFHRLTTRDELVAKFGEEIVAHERIVVHDSGAPAQLVEAGTLPSGGKLIVNRRVMEADLVVSEGFIEPHFFAGFSGGRKSVLPGVVSRETVLANHCAEFIASPYARTGNLEGNPIHRDMLYAAETAKLAFIVNVVINGEKKVVHAVAGHFRKAHEAGCAWLKDICRVRVPESDIVVTSNGGYPLDQNVYQSVKGMTAGEAVCRDGGVIVMSASCKDGAGGDSFYRNLAEAASPRAVLDKVLGVPRNRTEPDQWEFQILARVLEKHTVIMVTTHGDRAMLERMHLRTAGSLAEALVQARALVGADASIAVVPDGVSVISERADS